MAGGRGASSRGSLRSGCERVLGVIRRNRALAPRSVRCPLALEGWSCVPEQPENKLAQRASIDTGWSSE